MLLYLQHRWTCLYLKTIWKHVKVVLSFSVGLSVLKQPPKPGIYRGLNIYAVVTIPRRVHPELKNVKNEKISRVIYRVPAGPGVPSGEIRRTPSVNIGS